MEVTNPKYNLVQVVAGSYPHQLMSHWAVWHFSFCSIIEILFFAMASRGRLRAVAYIQNSLDPLDGTHGETKFDLEIGHYRSLALRWEYWIIFCTPNNIVHVLLGSSFCNWQKGLRSLSFWLSDLILFDGCWSIILQAVHIFHWILACRTILLAFMVLPTEFCLVMELNIH